MDPYIKTFNARGTSYNIANQVFQNVRYVERQLLIDKLDIKNTDLVCDIPAGGGYLSDELIRNNIKCIRIEPSWIFAKGISDRHNIIISNLQEISLKKSSVNRIGSLAGLHHLTNKQPFFDECYRILSPNGKIVVADVIENSNVGNFLNDVVDRLTDTGHKGFFFKQEEMSTLLYNSGFRLIEEKEETFTWNFTSINNMLTFFKYIFGLVENNYNVIKSEIEKYFLITESDSGFYIPWSLVYASGIK